MLDRTDLIRSLAAIPDTAATVADALDDLGCGGAVSAADLPPLRSGQRVCGPAVTLRYRRLTCSVADNRDLGVGARLGDRDLYASANRGDVAVIDCPDADAAVVGAISARWAALAGIAGCLVTGAVRDSASILDTGLPVWSRGRAPRAARYRYATESIGDPVLLAGNLVRAGDIVVADDDGICIVPADRLADVVRLCLESDRIERDLLAQMRCSTSLDDLRVRLRAGGTDVLDR